LVFRCVLGSEGCVLVPRSSGTPVATWAWPTCVVSRRRVLEALFILLEFLSPSRRIFIGSHSLPPLWFAVSVLQSIAGAGGRLICVGAGEECARKVYVLRGLRGVERQVGLT
jgi:hypothetical protein